MTYLGHSLGFVDRRAIRDGGLGDNLGIDLSLDTNHIARQITDSLITAARPRLVTLVRDDVAPAAMTVIRNQLPAVLDTVTQRLHQELPGILSSVRDEISAAVSAALGAVPTKVKVGIALALAAGLATTTFSVLSWRAALSGLVKDASGDSVVVPLLR